MNSIKKIFTWTCRAFLLFSMLNSHSFAKGKVFGFITRLEDGIGTMEGSSESVPSRSVSTTALSVTTGLRVFNLLIGPTFEYRYILQLENPASITDQNLTGKGYLMGVGLEYSKFKKINYFAKMYLSGQHVVDVKDVKNRVVSFQNPSGLKFGIGYLPKKLEKKRGLISLSYFSNTFSEQHNGELISKNSLSETGFSLGFSIGI